MENIFETSTSTPTFDIHKLNDFIQTASEQLLCDANCQQANNANKLEQSLMNAKSNLQTAPTQMHQAQKEYIIFTQGEQAYEELEDKQALQHLREIRDKLFKMFAKETDTLRLWITTYANTLSNYINVNDLEKHYLKENAQLSKQLRENRADIVTNERKTYYENQGIETLSFYYFYFLVVLYILCVVIYFGLSIRQMFQTTFVLKQNLWRFGMFGLFLVLPWAMPHLLYWVIWGITFVRQLLHW